MGCFEPDIDPLRPIIGTCGSGMNPSKHVYSLFSLNIDTEMLQYLIVSIENGPPGSETVVKFYPFHPLSAPLHLWVEDQNSTEAPVILPAYYWRHGPFHANWRSCTDKKNGTPYWLAVLIPIETAPCYPPSHSTPSKQLCTLPVRKPAPYWPSASSWLLAPSLLLRLNCCSMYNLPFCHLDC